MTPNKIALSVGFFLKLLFSIVTLVLFAAVFAFGGQCANHILDMLGVNHIDLSYVASAIAVVTFTWKECK